MATETKTDDFDTNATNRKMDLYSRAIAAVGLETMKNLSALKVLIIGLRGVGVETAKNLILAGPKQVSVWDDGMVNIADLGANFYLNDSHVGKVSRSEACTKTLGELNPYVTVERLTGDLSDSLIQSFGAVVVTETLSRKELVRINTLVRTRQIDGKTVPGVFILAVTHGISSHFFTDFGDNHVITDADGEPTKSLVIEEFTPDGRITVAAKRHGFDEVTDITFEDLEGEPVSDDNTICLSKLNDIEGLQVKRTYYTVTSKNSEGKELKREIQNFNILQLDWSKTEFKDKKLGAHKVGGLINEIKPKQVKQFRPFEATLTQPAEPNTMEAFFGPQHPDQGAWAEQGAGKMLHLLYASALEFNAQNGRFMELHSDDDLNKFKKIFNDINEENKKNEKISVENIDNKRLNAYSWYFNIELTGYCAFLGGVAAQEILKKFGKYTPVFQWLHSDHVQLVGNQIPSDAIAQNCRYDHQICLFGKAFQQLLGSQRIFLVGTGALGCEYLKGLSLMGVGAGNNGKVWCTDMDRIEVSNLSRQFLFRAQHVGQPKSKIASQVAREFNPAFNVEALEMKVWSETEDFFTDEFWDNLDLCWNALDNVHARKYTDSKCLLHGKPLLESGTQGTKCNSEVILPFKTKSYNDGEEQETEGIPMCTLQNFPYLPVHCIEWARSSFSDNFETMPKTFNTFVENRDKFFDQVEKASGEERVNMLRNVKNIVELQQNGVSYEACIRAAFNEYITQHYIRIKNLIHTFPEDEIVKDKYTGEVIGKFWSGHKRFPNVPKFDLNNENILQYLYCASNLQAFMFGLTQIRDINEFKKVAEKANLKVPEWKPSKVEVNEDEDDEKKNNNNNEPNADVDAECDELINFLKGVNAKKLKQMTEVDFEKDDDTNFHIDYITICANSRASNYRIKETSRHQCKIIAGKIIAALATTTAMITGLVELEFYKLKLGLSYVNEDAFYNANINLAVSQFQYFQPDAAIRNMTEEKKDPTDNIVKKFVTVPSGWTSWDSIVIDEGNLTVQEFVDLFPKILNGVEVELLYTLGNMEKGVALYNGSQITRSTKQVEANLAKPGLSDRLKTMYESELKSKREWNENLTKGRNSKLIDRYLELYTTDGKLVSDKRNYVLLSGSFFDADGNPAIIPRIKYVFKH